MDTHRLKACLLSSLALLVAFACALPAPAIPALPPTATAAAPPPTPADLYLTADDVALYPQPALYSGDLVTFDVTPHNVGEISPDKLTVRVYHGAPASSTVVAEGVLGYPAFDGIPRARLVWSWDTTGLVGVEPLTVWVDPDDVIQTGDEDPANNIATLTVPILPHDEMPAVEAAAGWVTVTTDCCILQYLSGTAAERDLPFLTAATAASVAHVEEQLDARLPAPFEVHFISRVIGHGGYACQGLTLSYLDRHYAATNLETVIRHEAAHVLDRTTSGWSPALITEGLAVWVAGGHYKPEPLPERAAALVELGWYIPLEELANDFYRQQHEIGYMEAGAFVAYLVETYGWEGFQRLKGAFDAEAGSEAAILDAALQEAFGVSLSESEGDFLDWLAVHPPGAENRRDVELTVRFFDAVRAYQQAYDPSAYFLSGWLPDPVEGARLSIEADFIRHPTTPENIALETMLIAARQALERADFGRCQSLLESIERALANGISSDPLAASYLAVVQATAALGYEAQRIDLVGKSARVWATADGPTLIELTLRATPGGWALSN